MKKLIDILLNNIASKGRYGDTTFRNVGGEISHVNPKEANAIDNYGLLGQYATQLAGSGTINPNTGLREYHDVGLDTYMVVDGEPVWVPSEHTHSGGAIYDNTGRFIADYEDIGYGADPTDPKDTPDITHEELRQFIDPNTGDIIKGRETAYVNYVRSIDPKYQELDDEGVEIWTDSEILDQYYKKAPSPFVAQEDIDYLRGTYETKAKGARRTAYESRLAAEKGGGSVFRPGQHGFGGTDTTISEGLATDIGTAHSKFGTDVFGLEQEKLKGFGEFLYGSVMEDSPYFGL